MHVHLHVLLLLLFFVPPVVLPALAAGSNLGVDGARAEAAGTSTRDIPRNGDTDHSGGGDKDGNDDDDDDDDRDASKYSVHWPNLLPEPGTSAENHPTYLNSMPIGNGHIAANVLYEPSQHTITALLSASSAFNEAGELIKVGVLHVRLTALPSSRNGTSQTLNPQTATVEIGLDDGGDGGDANSEPTEPTTTASVYVDAHRDVLVVSLSPSPSTSTAPTLTETARKVESATLLPLRTASQTVQPVMDCFSYDVSADVAGGDGTFVYHRNVNTTYMKRTFAAQNIPVAAADGLHADNDVMVDPLELRTTGARVAVKSDGTTVTVALLTAQSPTALAYEAELKALADRALSETTPASLEAHRSTWAERWSRHYVHIPSQPKLSSMYCLQRYLQLIQAEPSPPIPLNSSVPQSFPIKFNGQLFNAARPPNSDDRTWGSHNWWQNLRLPYYNMPGAGDVNSLLSSLLSSFVRTIPVAEARTRAYFNFDGLWWPEYTHPLLGTTHSAGYGCGREDGKSGSSMPGEPMWHSEDRWNGYNRQGSLDLALFVLDYLSYVRDDDNGDDDGRGANGGGGGGDIDETTTTTTTEQAKLLTIPRGVIQFYENLYGNTTNPNTGKMVIYPTQAVETWQCPGWPVDPTNCPTNDMPTIAGLRAVLEKLIGLPDRLVKAEWREHWSYLLESRVPDLPTDEQSGAYVPCDDCYEGRTGQRGCHQTSNTENAELYAVHPYRLATVARGNDTALRSARLAFARRRFTGDVGWNQNAIDAAMLGDALRASRLVLARSAMSPAAGYRFPAFAPKFQDFAPSADHLSVMNDALQLMLVAPRDGNDGEDGVMLLSAWPCEWEVRFRVWAPRRTVITGSFVDGRLEYTVEPERRRSAVSVAQCQRVGTSDLAPGIQEARWRRASS